VDHPISERPWYSRRRLPVRQPREPPRRSRFAVVLAALVGLLVAWSGARAIAEPASASDRALERITKANQRAVDEYQNLNFDVAKRILTDALTACTQAGLDKHRAAARTHVHLGVVLFAGFKQKDEAIREFKQALEIQPDIKLDSALATPEIQEVFDAAGSGAAPTGGAAQPDGGGAGAEGTQPSADAITHEPITKSRQGEPVPINVTVDSSVSAAKVVLSFSADGSDDFGKRDLNEASPGNWTGEIPASATEGAKVSYFLEAFGANGQVLAAKGSAADPMVVRLVGAAGQPLVAAKRKPEEPPPAEPPSEGGPTVFVGLGIGSGFGWTTGTGEINTQDKVSPAGFAAARLGQFTPEVGYFVSPRLLLSVQLRLQLVTGATPFYSTTCGASGLCAPSNLAVAGFGRAAWLFGADDWHPFVGGVAGAGVIRHVTSFPSVVTCGANKMSTCVDTVESGPVFIGGTAGVLYNLASSFALKAETNVLAGFGKFTLNIDIDLGIALEF
jgi:tetratricopeptide repeat protein